jgi:hypothetical protein
VVGDSGGTLAEALVGEDWGVVSYLWALACFKVDATSFSVSAMFELKFDNTVKTPDTLNVSVQRCGSVSWGVLNSCVVGMTS